MVDWSGQSVRFVPLVGGDLKDSVSGLVKSYFWIGMRLDPVASPEEFAAGYDPSAFRANKPNYNGVKGAKGRIMV